MSYLCCTKKIIDLLGVIPNQYEAENDTSILGSWYANVFLVERRKCVIFVNSKTLFSFVVINQTKKDIRQITSMFRRNLMKRLYAESVSLDIIDRIMKDHENITICKTYDRRILGAMKELTYHFRIICEMNEGLTNVNIDEINTFLAGTVMKLNKEYIIPRDTLKRIAV